MSGASKQRAGKERIESLGIPKHRFVEWWTRSDKADTAFRVAIALLAAAAMLVLCQAWRPPFAFREGMVPQRDIVTRVRFQVEDKGMTQVVRDQKAREVLALYRNRPQPLAQLRAALKDQLFLVMTPPSFDQMSKEEQAAFGQFYEGDETAPPAESEAKRFSVFKSVLASDPDLKLVDDAVFAALAEIRAYGAFLALQHTPEQGSQRMIRVFSAGQPGESVPVEVSRVRIAQAGEEFKGKLGEIFRTKFEGDDGQVVAEMLGDWIVMQLPKYETLQYDDQLSQQARVKAGNDVDPVMTTFYTGKSRLAEAGVPLDVHAIELLKNEWQVFVSKMHLSDMVLRLASYVGMVAAIYLLCGSYIFFVDNRELLRDSWQLSRLLMLVVASVSLAFFASRDQWRGELIPLVLAAIIAAVVYGRELALLLMASFSISVTLFLGGDLSDLVMMAAASTSCVLLLGRIRSRTHLLYVGGMSAAITAATVVGVGVVTEPGIALAETGTELEPLYRGPIFDDVMSALLYDAFYAGCWVMVSCTAMTGLLPLVERLFRVQTDLSLLELGDASHPLLRRLAQRAPGTYNHSINVASIAEAAADSIGANGLLVRVGAYFHDIGKMFKPEYFIENQSAGVNQHDSLQPAMSTLVIIAHVKDGADLARNHHLPDPIIDFILQHHGTTLVEYFYREAAKRSEEDPNGEAVSDKDFRYPGPKPQTLEAAVLMLADTVESASRTLVDPTSARIQGLVDSIAQKKVADGQFDECGLTFRQLHRIRQSLVKSLTAIYHARVKYPGQQSA